MIFTQQPETNGPSSRRRRVDLAASTARLETMSIEARRTLSLLRQLRSDYVVVERSVFSRLRSVWLLIKSIFRIGRRNEKFLALGGTRWENDAPSAGDAEACKAIVKAFAFRAGGALSGTDVPDVSIVIPAFNHCRATMECLESIARSWFDSLRVEIIVVDDGSSDETSALVSQVPTVRLVRSASNQGLVRACNRGAAEARGRYICFLNNDTQVQNAWLDHLVSLAESDHSIAAVSPKLIYPDGRLEAAGGIIWRDGSRAKYGFLSETSAEQYSQPRKVDYCPGSCLLVRRTAFQQVGGFSDEFTPAYYEDTDLCFKLRAQGYSCFFEPKSEVVHTGGLTWGRESDALVQLFEEVSRSKFVERWHEALSMYCEFDSDGLESAARRLEKETAASTELALT